MFAELGYDRTTIRAVAAAAGVDAGLVMHYFGSKDLLFARAVEVPADELPTGTSGEVAPIGTTCWRLTHLADATPEQIIDLLRPCFQSRPQPRSPEGRPNRSKSRCPSSGAA